MDNALYILIGVIIVLAICLAIANTAGNSFNRKYQKYSNMMLNTTYSAGEFAVRLVEDSAYKNLKIAYTENELGLYEDALSSVEKYLTENPDSEDALDFKNTIYENLDRD